MAIYMKFGSINGQVTTKGFEKWIELNSFQFGVGRAVGTAARGSANREGSEPNLSEITVTKVLDVSSNPLFQDATGGNFEATVKIKFTTTTKDTVTTFLTYELSNTGLSGYSISSGGQTPSESMSLNFSKVMITNSPLDSKGSATPDTVGYDLEKMAKV